MGYLESLPLARPIQQYLRIREGSPARLCGLASFHHGVRDTLSLSLMLLMTVTRLLLFASGIPTAEKPTAKRFYLMSHGPSEHPSPDAWNNYKAYLKATSLLVPFPPLIYRPLPAWIKRTILLDWPIYRFKEETDGKRAIEEAKQGQE